MIDNWYEDNIEEGVRDIVRLLRNNGFNTQCSCHHEDPMFIQCEYFPDYQIKKLHDLLWNYLYEAGKGVNFEIIVRHRVDDGHSYSNLDVRIPKELDAGDASEQGEKDEN